MKKKFDFEEPEKPKFTAFWFFLIAALQCIVAFGFNIDSFYAFVILVGSSYIFPYLFEIITKHKPWE